MFRKPDKPEKDTTMAAVYTIKCKDCEKVYIGQTNRALKTRLKEHKSDFFSRSMIQIPFWSNITCKPDTSLTWTMPHN